MSDPDAPGTAPLRLPDEPTTAGWQSPAVPAGVPASATPPTQTRDPAPGPTPGPGHPDRHTLSDDTARFGAGELAAPRLPQVPGYRVEQVIGRGGMGVVYRAVQLNMGRVVALKVIYPRGRDDYYVRGRFDREILSLARVEHPNIVPVYHAGDWHGFPYLTMKFVPGGALSQHLARFRGRPEACATLVAKVARAVQALHDANILHRDLKPLNILLGDGDDPLVADFGLAKCLDDTDSDYTHTGVPVGTRQYMAPEQTEGCRSAYTRSCDVWAIGVTLYELLAGRRPFADDGGTDLAESIRSADVPAVPDVPAGLMAVVRKCLAKKPEHRYPTAAAVADDLDRWLAGDLVPPTEPPRRRSRWSRCRSVLLALAGLASVSVAVVVATRVGHDPSPPGEPPGSPPVAALAIPPKPGEWRNLLTREPEYLAWPAAGVNNWRQFDPGQESLRLQCGETGLASLGWTDAARYELAATFQQNPWTGGIGLFFGYGERVIDGQPVLGYQVVDFHPAPPVKGKGSPQVRVSWRVYREIGPPGGKRRGDSFDQGKVGPSFSQAGGNKQLGITVGPKGLEAITLDGKMYPAADVVLTGVTGKPVHELSRAEFDGKFGIVVTGVHGTVRDAKFVYHEGRR